MKKFYYLVASIAIVLVTIIACEKSDISVDELQTIQQEELSAKGDKVQDKVDLCHFTGKKWVSISVAEASIDAHMAHGDKYSFSPEGVYTIYRDNADAGNHPTPAILNITLFSDGTIEGDGVRADNVEVNYFGTWTVTENTVLMTIPQYRKDNDKLFGTHYIAGFVLECGGLVEDLSDVSGSNVDYSFTEF